MAVAIRVGDRIIYDRHVALVMYEVIFVDSEGKGIGSEVCTSDATLWGASDSDLYALALAHFNLTAA